MRHLGRHLALAACVVVTGSVAHAAPAGNDLFGRAQAARKKHAAQARAKAAKHHAKAAKHPIEIDEESDDEAPTEADASAPRLTGVAHHPHVHDDGDSETDRVAFADPDRPEEAADTRGADLGSIQLDAPTKLHKLAEPASQDWHFAIGPYLWASSVDANVSLGPTTVSSGIDFIQLEQHAKYGAEVLGEARYKRFGIYGDLMYGVVAVDGSRDVGPLMVTLDGSASSILVDGAAGYTFYGDDRSLISLEGRAGVRYQRTGVSASVAISGSTVAPPEQVDAGADALAGGHLVVRPASWFSLSSAFDVGVVGASSKTWSASGDANVQLGARISLSIGYRTLTMDRTRVELVMHGPRAAVQLTF